MSDLYNQLCNMLIRPTRQTYHLYDLGNPLINAHGKREDFQIITRNSLKLKCSFYKTLHKHHSIDDASPTVIYLHSLNGSRLQFLSHVQPMLKMGFNIGTLDFAGCGLSEGSYVTLGAHQKYDVLQLVKYIYKTYKNPNFVIWGRSMGAVAAVKFYTHFGQKKLQHPDLRAIKLLALVMDSPFVSLNQLAVQIAKNKINMPQIVIKVAFYVVQTSIQQKANFKTSQLELESQVSNIHVPTLILTSKNDTLVSYEHSLCIYNKIPSTEKQLMFIESEHNSNRQQKDIKRIFQFISQNGSVKNSPMRNSRNEIGSLERKFQKLKAKSLRKYTNQAGSKQKLNRYQSQKNQVHFTKNNLFFQSNAVKTTHPQIKPDNQPQNLREARTRQISHDKILIQSDKQQNQRQKNPFKAGHINANQNYFSADRPKVNFLKESFFQNPPLRQGSSKQRQRQEKCKQKFISNLASIPQAQSKQKHLSHALSYKNIECLKTVKKIKRLQPQYINNTNEKEEVSKSHMNIITAKLKKKSKNGLAKSFLPHQIVEDEVQYISENQKTLKKQNNARSSTLLQLQNNHKNPNVNYSFQKYSLMSAAKVQRPSTPIFFSNRQIFTNETITKPFTPQIPLHSSMRINEIHQRKQESSKQDIFKMYFIQPLGSESSKGIKTTLNGRYRTNDQNRNQALVSSIAESMNSRTEFHDSKAQFVSSKKTLNSQIMSMRASTNFQDSKKFIIARRNPPNQIAEPQHDTSISLK